MLRIEEGRLREYVDLNLQLTDDGLREFNRGVGVVILLLQPKSEGIAGLLVGVKRVGHILTPDVFVFGMVEESPTPGGCPRQLSQ